MTAITCQDCGHDMDPGRLKRTICDDCLQRFSDNQEREYEEQQRQIASQRAERKLALQLEALPAAFRERSLADLDHTGNERAFEAAYAWARREIQGLALIGPFGVGKTTILAAAARECMTNGAVAVRWLSVPKALAHLSRDFSDPQRIATLDKITSDVGALILDDIDKARPTPHGAETLFTAIDNAIAEGQPLGVTTNLKPSELAQRWPAPYGDAIASRIAGHCRVIVLDGPDRRLAR